MNLLALALLQSFSLGVPVAPPASPAISAGLRTAVVEVVVAPTLSAEAQLVNAPSLMLTADEYPSTWPRAFETRATGKYFGARYYRANVGRFTTIDPVYTWEENLVDPQRWNRYAYVRNNPLKYVDPDGRVLVPALLVAWGAVELGLQLYDSYSTVQTLTDPNASLQEKAISGGGFLLGAIAPGGGYGAAGKKALGVANKVDDVQDAGRAGLPFTRKGKREVIEENAQMHGGQTTCLGCSVPTTPATQSKLGVPTPKHETRVDHRIPKSKGGAGSPSNGQVLCSECNLRKGDKLPSEQ